MDMGSVMLINLVKGVIVGLAASIPLGPIGVLCVQRTLGKGRFSGFVTGVGAAAGDLLYSTLAILSITYIKFLLEDYKLVVHILGGLIVAGIGVKIFFTNPATQIPRKNRETRHFADFGSSFLMTVTNPGALLLIMGLFSYVGITTGKDAPWMTIVTTLLGVVTGSLIWWATLSGVINFFREKVRLKQLVIVNRVSGIIIAIIGIVTLFDGLYRILYPVVSEYIIKLVS